MKKFLFIYLCFINFYKCNIKFLETFKNGHNINDLDENSLIGLSATEVEKTIGKPVISTEKFLLFICSNSNVNPIFPIIEKVKCTIILILKTDINKKIVSSQKKIVNSKTLRKELVNVIKKRINSENQNIKNSEDKLKNFNKGKLENQKKRIEKESNTVKN